MGTEVIAISMVKDEADVIAETVTHMLGQVDGVIVADNGSTDGTREILEQLPVELIDDPDPAYYQSAKMSRLAAIAGERGARWVIPFDADEIWYSPFGRIADALADRPETIATATLYDHVATAADEAGTPVERIGWRRRDPAPLPKVAVRPALPVEIHQGNHGASYSTTSIDGLLVVRHFPYRSPEQFVTKARNGAAAYAATDLPTNQGAHWRQYGALLEAHGPEVLHSVFRQWFWDADPEHNADLIFDPAP